MEAVLFHADGRTDMTKLIVYFYNFAKVPKTYAVLYACIIKIIYHRMML
jgi:hypothetical protein